MNFISNIYFNSTLAPASSSFFLISSASSFSSEASSDSSSVGKDDAFYDDEGFMLYCIPIFPLEGMAHLSSRMSPLVVFRGLARFRFELAWV